jgi:hypothetical protein
MDRLKTMPYRIEPGAIDMVKIRSKAAIERRAAKVARRRVTLRWVLPFAAAIFIGVALFGYVELAEPTHYELLMEQVASAPADVLFEMTADIVEYAEDITML